MPRPSQKDKILQAAVECFAELGSDATRVRHVAERDRVSEDALYRHPAVAVAAVVAMPDPKWGEVPCAFVELREGASATEAEIVAHCRQLLAGFKVPKVVRFGELPKTATGKIQKFQLRHAVGSDKAIDLAGDKK